MTDFTPIVPAACDEAVDAGPGARPAAGGEQASNRGILSAAELAYAMEKQQPLSNIKLGELLLAERLVTPQQLDHALGLQQSQRKRVGEILIDQGVVSSASIQKALSRKLGIPYVDVGEFAIDPKTLALVPRSVAIRQQVLPLLRLNDMLAVAVENPLMAKQVEDVKFLTQLAIVPVMADPRELRLRIALEYSALDASACAPAHASVGESVADSAAPAVGASAEAEALALQLDQQAPTQSDRKSDLENEGRVSDNVLVRLVNKIITDAHTQGASDIHIESNPRPSMTRVRFRKDGEMEDYLSLQPAYRNALISRIKVMAGLDISERRRAQDGKINFAPFGLPIELRVAVVPTHSNLEDVVLRLLGSVEPLPMERLGLSMGDMAVLKTMVTRSHGLILVCGPTGSGKTTTLHSLLRQINRPDMKIWTAEDPVEITQPGLRQVQINARIGWTFASAMRAFLRADPDVIMVGEMRDVETAKIGIEASLTGHLVCSTLHTNSAAECVVRLLELGMDPFNFSDALIGVLSQRLARRLCPHCRKPHAATEAELAELAVDYCQGTGLEPAQVVSQWKRKYAGPRGVLIYKAVGCKSCTGGYRGRIGIFELLPSTPTLKALIRSGGTVPQLTESGQENGMKLLRQDAIEKVLEGLVDVVAARAASS